MTDPWCCYIWCSMDPINIPPINVSINIPAPWIRHGIFILVRRFTRRDPKTWYADHACFLCSSRPEHLFEGGISKQAAGRFRSGFAIVVWCMFIRWKVGWVLEITRMLWMGTCTHQLFFFYLRLAMRHGIFSPADVWKPIHDEWYEWYQALWVCWPS